MILVFIFFGGLVIGSFLNSVIGRLRNGQSFLLGRSYCPKCQHRLGFQDLIPLVSFAFQKGRCRYCRAKISWQYPLVEVITALLFCLVYLKLDIPLVISNFQLPISNFQLKAYGFLLRDWYFLAILIIIFVYDLRWSLILDKVTLPAMVVALSANLLLGTAFTNLALAAIIGGGFFGLQFLASRGAWIGAGDIRLGALMGLILGWPGVLVALFLAYLIGALVSLGLIIFKKKSWQSQIPFGTFLSLSTIIVLFYTQEILNWYLRLINLG